MKAEAIKELIDYVDGNVSMDEHICPKDLIGHLSRLADEREALLDALKDAVADGFPAKRWLDAIAKAEEP